jgi:large subunit ribosomal protein L25
MRTIAVTGTKRDEISKQSLHSLRREDKIPCVLYGGEENIHFSVDPYDVKDLIYTSEFKVVELEIDGETNRCIMKSVQFHPVLDTIQHIDFLRLIEGVPVKVAIPVNFVGTAAGLRTGGKLIKKIRKIMIKTTPDKLVDELALDVTELILGQSVRVRDIKVEEGVEILNDLSMPVASVEVPRILKTTAPGEEEGEEGEEGEGEAGEGGEGEGGESTEGGEE